MLTNFVYRIQFKNRKNYCGSNSSFFESDRDSKILIEDRKSDEIEMLNV